MKAVRFYASRDVRFEDVAAPGEIGPNQILMKPSLCGICGTDLHEYIDGPHWTPRPRNEFSGATLPQILGHEFAGEVLEVGRDVRRLKAGDRVSIQPQVGSPTDYFGRRGYFHFSPTSAAIGLSWPWGGMGELAVVNEMNAIRMPDEVTDQQGAMAEPAAVAVQSVDRGGVRSGDTVLVTGAGPIGALVAMAAVAAGAAKVIVSEVSPGRRDRIAALNVASNILDPTDDDFVAQVIDQTEERVGVDVAIECSGNARALQQCMQLTRAQGTVVVTGNVHGSVSLTPFEWILKGLSIHATLCYPTDMWPRIYKMMASGKFPVEKLIDKVIHGKDIVAEGFQPLLDPQSSTMKILVRCID